MRPIVNPLGDPAVDALWAQADLGALGLPKYLSPAMIRVLQARRRPAAAMGGKFGPAVTRALLAQRPDLVLRMQERQRQNRAAVKQSIARSKWARQQRRRGMARAVEARRQRMVGPGRRLGPTAQKWGRRRGMSSARIRALCAAHQDAGVSGIGEEYALGSLGDETYTLGDVGDLGGFFKKVKRRFKKVIKKVGKVGKKIIKSKAFKIAAIGALAFYAGPAIISKLAVKKGITTMAAKAALKRGAKRLGNTGAQTIGVPAAEQATPAAPENVDYEAIMNLGMQPDATAAAQLATVATDPTSMYVPGEQKPGIMRAGMGGGTALLIGGGLLAAVIASGMRPRVRSRYR